MIDDGDRLYAALQARDRGGYQAVLAGLNVFMPSPRVQGDEVLAGTETGTGHVTYRERGITHIDVWTVPSLTQPCRPDVFYRWLMWDRAVRILEQHKFGWTMVVNRGTAVEFRIMVPEAADWLNRNPQAVRTWDELAADVRFTRAEPLEGPLARALACGAHLSVINCMPWNSMIGEYVHYVARSLSLRDSWGIRNARDWRRQVDMMLDVDRQNATDLLLSLRSTAVAKDQPASDPALLTRIAPAGLEDTAYWIGVCESWMRRDGVLPADGFVRTQAAWNLGRAVNLARWGMQCGFCDRGTAEGIVLHAGQLCADAYRDWSELSAAYLLGRVLQMGRGEDRADWYANSLRTHLALMNSEVSPFRTLSLH